MIVVSDTSALNYLILIGAANVLPALFDQIVIPRSVETELLSPSAPRAVHQWIQTPPAWLEVRSAARIDPDLRLDPGEIEAICLAEELHADHLLIDEWAGRDAARRRGLQVIGTLGVLAQAAERNLLDLHHAFDQLKETTFRVDPALLDLLLAADRRRRRGG